MDQHQGYKVWCDQSLVEDCNLNENYLKFDPFYYVSHNLGLEVVYDDVRSWYDVLR